IGRLRRLRGMTLQFFDQPSDGAGGWEDDRIRPFRLMSLAPGVASRARRDADTRQEHDASKAAYPHGLLLASRTIRSIAGEENMPAVGRERQVTDQVVGGRLQPFRRAGLAALEGVERHTLVVLADEDAPAGGRRIDRLAGPHIQVLRS